eukprot:5988501-Amphidinium_carterae.1
MVSLSWSGQQAAPTGVERDYINGEHTSLVVPMMPIGNVPLSTLPWTGRTKYHLRRIDTAAP